MVVFDLNKFRKFVGDIGKHVFFNFLSILRLLHLKFDKFRTFAIDFFLNPFKLKLKIFKPKNPAHVAFALFID